MSIPTVASSSPMSSEIAPFTCEPWEMITEAVRPSTAIQKYSYEVKFSANSARSGAATISTSAPTMPPITEPRRATPSARAPWPARVCR
jgi:hypothetical protein